MTGGVIIPPMLSSWNTSQECSGSGLITTPPKRAEGFLHQIKEIHKAGILHDDPHPRNMMVFGDDPDRVMWIDFDRAQVDDGVFYTSETLQEMLDEEDILVAEVGPMIVSLSNCYRCFRSWFSFLTGFLGK